MTGKRNKIHILNKEGIRAYFWDKARYLASRFNPFRGDPLSGIYPEDAIQVDWTIIQDFNSQVIVKPENGYKVAWIISPPSPSSGGHQNAFRFIKALEASTDSQDIYFYAPNVQPEIDLDGLKVMLEENPAYPALDAQMHIYSPEQGFLKDYDAIFAVDWETAYPVFRYKGRAKRLYFAQDFEPAFFPWSSASVLAENTYKFGFHGLTIGKWLSQKLTHEYGMTSDYYDYAVDKKNYSVTNVGNRNEIVFYARPPTPRRATEFGLLVLSELHRQRPDIIINLVGWDMDGYKVPFPFVNHKSVKITQLNGIYNRCSAGLVLSLTNMSLLPLELLSAGVVPVVNDADNTKEVINSPNISYVPLSPLKIVKEIIDIIDSPDHGLRAQKLSLDVQNNDWSGPAAQFVEKFEKAMITSLKPDHSQWQK